MATAFATGQFGAVEARFNTRIAAPWLVSWILGTASLDFLVLNSATAAAFAGFWFWLGQAMGLRNIAYFALLCWVQHHPQGFTYYHTVPESVDPMAHTMLAAITWIYFTRHHLLLPTLLLTLLTKESLMFICLIMIDPWAT